MNFLEKIRSCFWQDDEGAPNQRGTKLGAPVGEPVPIEKTEENDTEELERTIRELREEAIEMMVPVNMLNKTFWNFLDEIEKAAKEFNVAYSLVDNIAYCEGKAKDVERFETLLQKFHNAAVGEEERRITYHGDYNCKKGTWGSKSVAIPLDFTKEDVDVVLLKAKKGELQFLYRDNVLKIRGNKFNLSMFVKWYEEFSKRRAKEKQEFKEFLENLKLETMTEKIPNSYCDDLQKQDILKKSSTFEIECLFDEENRSLEVSGRADKVRCFKSFLQVINLMFPKHLYPLEF